MAEIGGSTLCFDEPTRVFETGATRGKDDDKLDYEGFISPLVWTRYSQYMHKCRLRNIPEGQTLRASDNWQRGMTFESYMKSGFRHFMDWWTGHRFGDVDEEALCALLFNVQGYLHEMIKARNGRG
jgi:hypothetical protein